MDVTEHNTILFSENIELCLFVKFSDLGIGEVSGTHPPASSRLYFQVTKRRRTEERGLGQQDYTMRIISIIIVNQKYNLIIKILKYYN